MPPANSTMFSVLATHIWTSLGHRSRLRAHHAVAILRHMDILRLRAEVTVGIRSVFGHRRLGALQVLWSQIYCVVDGGFACIVET